MTRHGYFEWNSVHRTETLSNARSFFERNGYVVFTSHATAAQTASLRAAAQRIVQDFHAAQTATCTFRTDADARMADDEHFLTSATKVRCFLEARKSNAHDDDAKRAVNKIGHALHDLPGAFASFSRARHTRELADALGFGGALLTQSMYILKEARVGGAVPAHRDATFVRAQSARADDTLGLWWALQASTLQNGCLWVSAGSHEGGALPRVMSVVDGQTSVVGEDESDVQWTPLEMEAGDVVALHGGVLHRSLDNHGEHSRHAYSLHVVRGQVARDCWLSAGARANALEQPFGVL